MSKTRYIDTFKNNLKVKLMILNCKMTVPCYFIFLLWFWFVLSAFHVLQKLNKGTAQTVISFIRKPLSFNLLSLSLWRTNYQYICNDTVFTICKTSRHQNHWTINSHTPSLARLLHVVPERDRLLSRQKRNGETGFAARRGGLRGARQTPLGGATAARARRWRRRMVVDRGLWQRRHAAGR